MANIGRGNALQQIQHAIANLYHDRADSDFWGKITLEIVWENGRAKQINIESRETVRIIEQASSNEPEQHDEST